MTNFSARSNGRQPKGRNKKDGGGGPHRRVPQDWEALGFEWVPPTPSTHTYTWGGSDFPIFTICPGYFEGEAGLVAKCDNPIVTFLLPYGTNPALIKQLLDFTITEIMRLDADMQCCSECAEDWS